jgi:hypothetical protein
LIKLDSLGRYDLQPGAGTRAEIKIRALMPDGNVYQHSKYFPIRNAPAPTMFFGGKDGRYELSLTEDEVKSGKVSMEMVNFDYDLSFTVKSFKIKFPRRKAIEVEGDVLNKKAIKKLRKMKTGDVLTIYDVRTSNSSGAILTMKTNPILIRIKKA